MIREYFTISNCVFNFSFLSLVLYEIIMVVPNLHYGALRPPPWMPPNGNIFIPKTSTLAYLIAFLTSTFQLQQFPRYQGVPNLHQEGLRTLDAPQRKKFCTKGEYFTTSNCIFNFSFLSLVFYEMLGGPKFTSGGPAPPEAPQQKNVDTRTSTCQYLYNCKFSASQLH